MNTFTFNISLSVLNHLGRNLYRSFITVLGEAISNSWDADAKNVNIYIDRDAGMLVIQDDGSGMTEEDFQNKFLKIGYSKRKNGISATPSGRPLIGRKGIGKLALLSCAKTITVLSKTKDSELIGGVIDNSELDEAIKEDRSSEEYKLALPSQDLIEKYGSNLLVGTTIVFENLNDGIKNRVEFIRKLVALYYRFSLIDKDFNISLNGELIKLDDLSQLMDNTQLLWEINDPVDPYLAEGLVKKENVKRIKKISSPGVQMHGFIASVEKPSMLKILGTDEKVSIDLFVNGRLREKDILRHIPTARIVESYLYGQIHFNGLDDANDRFTSNREGIVSDDPKFVTLLKSLEKVLKEIIDDWDLWRLELKQEGDSENIRITPKQRKSKALFNEISQDFVLQQQGRKMQSKVEKWVTELEDDATFNFASYAECFISENLLRNFLQEKKYKFKDTDQQKLLDYKNKEKLAKGKANINFDIRANNDALYYFSMSELAEMAEISANKGDQAKASLFRDAQEYKPIRDALAHTSRLTGIAKNRLNSTYENIKARIIILLKTV